MRLLVAMLNKSDAETVRDLLYMDSVKWDIELAANGEEALLLLQKERFDELLLHSCLPKVEGIEVLRILRKLRPVCPPRILLVSEPEMCCEHRAYVDCTAPLCAEPERLCSLLRILAKKPLPKLAAANREAVERETKAFLDALSFRTELKGRDYAQWLLKQIVPSPVLEEWPMYVLYADCARAHHTTSAAVERCLRVAVESVFTQGNMRGIERLFGSTVDPERGKPTNRAFIMQAVQELRVRTSAYSLTEERSPKSMEIHQSPAAPTIV